MEDKNLKVYTDAELDGWLAEINRSVENRMREVSSFIAERLVEFCQNNPEMTCMEALDLIRDLIVEAKESVH